MPACHDTASAVASVEAGGTSAFLSSGTWSLLGTELPSADRHDRTRELNFTNEGGVGGTTRLLKNIGGLWLLQSCRRSWARAGESYGYDELLAAASEHAPAFTLAVRSGPSRLPASRRHGRGDRGSIAGRPDSRSRRVRPAYARAILESLAFKYRRCSSRSKS